MGIRTIYNLYMFNIMVKKKSWKQDVIMCQFQMPKENSNSTQSTHHSIIQSLSYSRYYIDL